MQEVRVNISDLRKVVKENRDKHKADYEKAFAGYRQECIEKLERWLDDFKNGDRFEIRWIDRPPEDHTKKYDQVLAMLDMSVETAITLSNLEFQNYVMDDWSWKDSWLASNTSYMTKAEEL